MTALAAVVVAPGALASGSASNRLETEIDVARKDVADVWAVPPELVRAVIRRASAVRSRPEARDSRPQRPVPAGGVELGHAQLLALSAREAGSRGQAELQPHASNFMPASPLAGGGEAADPRSDWFLRARARARARERARGERARARARAHGRLLAELESGQGRG
jgi:hypothetical protein